MQILRYHMLSATMLASFTGLVSAGGYYGQYIVPRETDDGKIFFDLTYDYSKYPSFNRADGQYPFSDPFRESFHHDGLHELKKIYKYLRALVPSMQLWDYMAKMGALDQARELMAYIQTIPGPRGSDQDLVDYCYIVKEVNRLLHVVDPHSAGVCSTACPGDMHGPGTLYFDEYGVLRFKKTELHKLIDHPLKTVEKAAEAVGRTVEQAAENVVQAGGEIASGLASAPYKYFTRGLMRPYTWTRPGWNYYGQGGYYYDYPASCYGNGGHYNGDGWSNWFRPWKRHHHHHHHCWFRPKYNRYEIDGYGSAMMSPNPVDSGYSGGYSGYYQPYNNPDPYNSYGAHGQGSFYNPNGQYCNGDFGAGHNYYTSPQYNGSLYSDYSASPNYSSGYGYGYGWGGNNNPYYYGGGQSYGGGLYDQSMYNRYEMGGINDPTMSSGGYGIGWNDPTMSSGYGIGLGNPSMYNGYGTGMSDPSMYGGYGTGINDPSMYGGYGTGTNDPSMYGGYGMGWNGQSMHGGYGSGMDYGYGGGLGGAIGTIAAGGADVLSGITSSLTGNSQIGQDVGNAIQSGANVVGDIANAFSNL